MVASKEAINKQFYSPFLDFCDKERGEIIACTPQHHKVVLLQTFVRNEWDDHLLFDQRSDHATNLSARRRMKKICKWDHKTQLNRRWLGSGLIKKKYYFLAWHNWRQMAIYCLPSLLHEFTLFWPRPWDDTYQIHSLLKKKIISMQ